MKFDEVAILLNCHSLEDFPVFHRGKQADSLLACWTSLWHPQLIAQCGQMPTWYRLDDPPTHDRARLLIRPAINGDPPADDLASEVAAAGGLLIDQPASRSETLEQIGSMFGDHGSPDDDLAADFMALGYAYLQIELLTRQMRYSKQLAESAFTDNLVNAARKAVAGEDADAQTLLQSCFDLLSQERNHYYAVDIYLIDVSLVAASLIGKPLCQQLGSSTISNLLIEAHLLEQMERDEPESLDSLREALGESRAGLLGGEYQELPLELLSTDTIRRQIARGLDVFQRTVGRRPYVFGRRRFGLVPVLPQILLRLDYVGALHATFDGGRFPEATQAKSRWEGDGQFSIDAIMRAPLDATLAETFLNLSSSLSETMDMDHIATRCFAHWVGDASVWYDVLQRVTRYTHCLGRFVTVDEYFRDTYDPGIHDRFKADQYRSPWLKQQIAQRDSRPISRWTSYWRDYLRLQSWLACSILWLLVQDDDAARRQVEQAEAALEAFSRNPTEPQPSHATAEVGQQLCAAAAGLVSALANVSAALVADSGCSLVNPWSFPRRVGLADCPVTPEGEPPVYAVEPTDRHRIVADVPAMGVSQLTVPTGENNSTNRRRGRAKSPPPMAEDRTLRNEFLEAQLDPNSGGLAMIRDYRGRSNRLSQQLAIRLPTSSTGEVEYTAMCVDSLQITHADALHGQIQSRGRLTGRSNATLAEFLTTYDLWRGSRVLELRIELTLHQQLEADPWNHYVACRFAWSNEAADVLRGVNDTRIVTEAKRFVAPWFVQIDEGGATTTLLTGGLPFHRRVGRRMLDSLLIVGDEVQRQFHLGVGVDLKQPFRNAITLMSPDVIVPFGLTGSCPSSTWLVHFDSRHVLGMLQQPVWDEDRLTGVRLRILEVDGHAGSVGLTFFRPLQSARKIDGLGQSVEICEVDEARTRVRVSPYEQIDMEVLFRTDTEFHA